MKHSINCLSKPAFLQVTVEEYAIMYTPEGEIYNNSVLERLVCCWQIWYLAQDKTRQDKARQLYYISAHNTVMTDLAPQVAEANRGEPGTIKINEIN